MTSTHTELSKCVVSTPPHRPTITRHPALSGPGPIHRGIRDTPQLQIQFKAVSQPTMRSVGAERRAVWSGLAGLGGFHSADMLIDGCDGAATDIDRTGPIGEHYAAILLYSHCRTAPAVSLRITRRHALKNKLVVIIPRSVFEPMTSMAGRDARVVASTW